MNAHPFADRFPMLSDDELDRLAADIAENGLRTPVVLDTEGRILDGRNRWAACERAGVTPATTVYEGDDPAAFVLSANVSRRHLTTGQQAMSTALVLSDAGKRKVGKWAYGTAALGNSENLRNWQKHMQVAGVILDHAPELADAVVEGSLALDAAFKQAEFKRDAERQALAEIERMQAEEQESRDRLMELAPDYMKALDNGEYKSARQAFVAWEDANRAAAAKRRQQEAARVAEEKRRRADLSLTYTSIAEGLLSVGSYAHADIEETMKDFDPSLLNPPQLIRYFSTENLRAGIKFLNDLIGWKETEDA